MTALVLDSTFADARRGAEWVRETLAGALPEERVADAELAAAEALTNVVRHGYHGAPGHRISVSVSLEDSRATLEITDEGTPLPPELQFRLQWSGALDTDPSAIEESGRGLMLIGACADDVLYARRGAVNTMTLIFDRHYTTSAEGGRR